MKKIFLFIALVGFISTGIMGQDPARDLKNAEKSLKRYIQDSSNLDELNKSMALLESAFSSEEVKAEAKSWITRAKIFNEIANAEFKLKTLNPDYEISKENAAIEAFTAYNEASKLAEKKNDLRDIETGLTEVENHLNNFAIFAYQIQDYNNAFENFSVSIDARSLLNSMNKPSRLDVDSLLIEQYFYAAVSAYYGEKLEEAVPFLLKLYEGDSQEAFVYEALYNINSSSNPDEAVIYLEKGRKLFPDDTGLLFAEINHYLKSGKLGELISKLELAMEKEPENISIITTLGSVYDQLHQKEQKAGNTEKSMEYFDYAMLNYEKVLERDPENFDAKYSVGALYYNKAANYVEELNELAADFSTEGMKKYDALKAEMDGIFQQSLPYFLEAEKLNATDMNTLIALKEIHARLNELEISEAYKVKLEKVTEGQ